MNAAIYLAEFGARFAVSICNAKTLVYLANLGAEILISTEPS